jgi:hypothetical protein
MRITLDGERAEINTNIPVKPEQWDMWTAILLLAFLPAHKVLVSELAGCYTVFSLLPLRAKIFGQVSFDRVCYPNLKAVIGK